MSKPDTLKTALIRWCRRRGTKQGVSEWLDYVEDTNQMHLRKAVLKRLKQQARKAATAETVNLSSGRDLSAKAKAHLEHFFPEKTLHSTTGTDLIAGIEAYDSGKKISANFGDQLRDLSANL